MTSIAVAWMGMPDYAARCIKAFVDDFGGDVEVVATRPDVPIAGMERSLGQTVHWIRSDCRGLCWQDLGINRPDILLQGGYSVPSFRSLAADARSIGGRVVLASDINWQGTLQQRFVDRLRHKLLFRRKFDAVMTPGAAGIRYIRAMGYSADRTVPGLYGADPSLFNGGAPLIERSQTFLFVGQYIARKNVLDLAEAFLSVVEDHPDWSLVLCGSGSLHSAIPVHPTIRVLDFLQPPQLAELMRHSRCVVLPSLEEHWGVVVHEAVLSGCALALANVVGAAPDFARPENSVLFRPGDKMAIACALRQIIYWDDAHWAKAEATSRALGVQFGPHRFSSELRQLIDRLLKA
ncbi:MAG: glycosyltransferase family 4 protein [Rhodospirillales bacterium]|nr:glycosyltransferase family 4 protein [Rhodospirillales bacterium]